MNPDTSRGAGEIEKSVGTWLSRFIAGQAGAHDVQRLARDRGFASFAELCSSALPDRLPRLRFHRDFVRREIRRALNGELAFHDLRTWASELHAIAFRHELGSNRRERRIACEALALVSVAADREIFRTASPVERVLAAMIDGLSSPDGLPTDELYARLFSGQEVLHLAARRPTIAPDPEDAASVSGEGWVVDPSWADVVARPEAGRARSTDPSAVVAFALVTEEAAEEDAVDYASHAVRLPDVVTRARSLFPNFSVARYRPRVQRDIDGVLEFVLRTDEIDATAILYATKLFALIHAVPSVTLEGERISTLSGHSPIAF